MYRGNEAAFEARDCRIAVKRHEHITQKVQGREVPKKVGDIAVKKVREKSKGGPRNSKQQDAIYEQKVEQGKRWRCIVMLFGGRDVAMPPHSRYAMQPNPLSVLLSFVRCKTLSLKLESCHWLHMDPVTNAR